MFAPTRRFVIPLLALGALAAPRRATAQRIAEIQVAPRFMRMRQDAVAQLSATAYDVNGTPVDVSFHWRSSNINVVTVDSLGNVHAIWPGNAFVMAWTEEGGRRRMGQVAVQVQREVIMPGYPGGPPPGAFVPPGAMPAPNVPGAVPPRMPPGAPPTAMPNMGMIDSSIRASINCADPMINAVNPLRVCWETRAVPRDSVVEPEAPGPDKCPYGASPVGLLVKVSETGDVSEVRPYSPSSCAELNDRASAFARSLHYSPATRGGKPVSSWRVIRLRGRRP